MGFWREREREKEKWQGEAKMKRWTGAELSHQNEMYVAESSSESGCKCQLSEQVRRVWVQSIGCRRGQPASIYYTQGSRDGTRTGPGTGTWTETETRRLGTLKCKYKCSSLTLYSWTDPGFVVLLRVVLGRGSRW